MKKRKIIILGFLFLMVLVSCKNNISNSNNTKPTGSEISSGSITSSKTSTPSNYTTTKSETTTSKSTSSNISSKTNSSSSSIPSKDQMMIASIKELGKELDDNSTLEVSFDGMYVKLITDNTDKLMLFVDDSSYINVRVSNSAFNDYLKNRYLNCYYKVKGLLSRKNNQLEVAYELITNITSSPEDYDYTLITKDCNTILDVYNDIDNISLSEKKNGVGSIVTFNGVLMSTDRFDANKKAVLYDNDHLITVISDKKICDGKLDLGKELKITGITSVKNGAPAVLLLDMSIETKKIEINYQNALEVNPSYFSKWYHLLDNMKDPSYSDYAKLYLVSGYVSADESRKSAYYFGISDKYNDNLSDTGIKTVIKGVYLMNHLNIKEDNVLSDIFYNYYGEDIKISLYCSLYQFDSQNHGWKIFPFETTLKEA